MSPPRGRLRIRSGAQAAGRHHVPRRSADRGALAIDCVDGASTWRLRLSWASTSSMPNTVLFLLLFRLQQWAFEIEVAAARAHDFPARRQRRYAQPNDAWGRVVSVACWRGRLG